VSTPKQEEKAPKQRTDAERIADLEKRLAAAETRAALAPMTTVVANGGGPGVDVFHPSWSLGAQTAANAGEWHDEWGDPPEE